MNLTDSSLIIFWLILLAILVLLGLLIYFLLVDSLRKKTWAPRALDSVFLEVSMPKENSDKEKQLHAQYPKAQVELVRSYNIFAPRSYVAAAELGLQKNYSFPIRTFKVMETDPMNSITNSLSKLTEGEGAVIQLLISPAHNHWQAKARSYALQIQQGRNPDQVTSHPMLKALNVMFRAIGAGFDQLLGAGLIRSWM